MQNSGEIEWCRLAAVGEIPAEDVVRIELGERAFAVYNVMGEFYASDDCCTHQEARLSDGFVIDDVIECPLHQGRFYIPNGDAIGPPVSKALKVYPVKVADGQIYVGIEKT